MLRFQPGHNTQIIKTEVVISKLYGDYRRISNSTVLSPNSIGERAL
jgi:hypothetical protein